jgi:hypothetical protein
MFPKNPGIFAGIENEEKLKELPSLNYLSTKVKIGEFIGKSSDGYKMTAVVILHNSNIKQFEADLNFINNSVYIVSK